MYCPYSVLTCPYSVLPLNLYDDMINNSHHLIFITINYLPLNNLAFILLKNKFPARQNLQSPPPPRISNGVPLNVKVFNSHSSLNICSFNLN